MQRRVWPFLVAAAGYSALACIRFWPLVHHAGDVVTRPGDDALLNSWILWWNVHAVPLTDTWWNAPIFYPVHGTMAFSELLLGELLIAAPVQWLTHNPVLAHNAAVLLSFPLCALAAHALAFELTRRHDAAALAALAFGFGAIRANYIGHVQMLSYYWAPVALFCLHRSLRGSRPVWWLVGSAVACLMQVLCNGYALFQLPLLLAAWIVWFPPTLRQRVAAVSAVAAGLLPLVPILLRYRSIHASFGFERSITEIRMLSADIGTLFQAHAENVELGRVISAGSAPGLFPGLTVVALLVIAIALRQRTVVTRRLTWDRVALGAIALAAGAIALSIYVFGPWSMGPLTASHPHKPLGLAILAAAAYFARGPRWRGVWQSRSVVGFYALSAAGLFVLSFGPEPTLFGERVFYQAPYAWLMRLPGFNAVRAPDRLALLAVLCLSAVVATTYARWAVALKSRRLAVSLLLCAGLVLDGWFRMYVQPLPASGPPGSWRNVQAIVELPLTSVTDASAMYRSMRPGPPLINGTSGYAPPHYPLLRETLASGDFTILQKLGLNGALGVSIDRTAPESTQLKNLVSTLPGAELIDESESWVRYRLPSIRNGALGSRIAIASVTARPAQDQAPNMIDGVPGTTWSSLRQRGDEEVLVDLSTTATVAAVEMTLGSAWFWAPQDLSVEASVDGTQWTSVWRGPTSGLAVCAALIAPTRPSLLLQLDPFRARFIRLRQHRTKIDDPWVIAELRIYGP